MKNVRIGIAGTSWWSDAMYLPALKGTPEAEVVAVCGRNPERTQQFAHSWAIPQAYTDYQQMLERAELDAVIVATNNKTHAPFTVAALERDLHVLCEKPLGLNYAEAAHMTQLATARGRITLTPFTYGFMPTTRYLKELIDDGFIGQPYHCNLRYYTGYNRSREYMWRHNAAEAGSGAFGDIGSHFIYVASLMFGPVAAVTCRLGFPIERPNTTPDGEPFAVTEDTAMLLMEFTNGAQGSLHVSSVAYEDTPFGQTHHMEFHGSGGTLATYTDWDTIQEVRGARAGEGALRTLPIPDHIWGNARRDTVHNTYRDVFRQEGHMIGEFVRGVQRHQPVAPDFAAGTEIQRVLDAGLLSHREERRVRLTEIG